MRFADPQMLWLLLAVPLVIVGIALRFGWRRRVMAQLGHLPKIVELTSSVSATRRIVKSSLLTIGLALLVIAMARPQAGERSSLAPALGIDIVVALDFSKSMLAQDAYPSRIERAKAELNRLIDHLKGDRLGLVAFAGETLSYPLTTDYAAAKLFWKDLGPADMPVGGTAIGKAITAATRLLTAVRNKSTQRSQVILLLTDGEDHESDPIAAAKETAKLGVGIFSVGIGSRSGEPVPDINEDGSRAGYVEFEGKPVTTHLDDKTLSEIAAITKGRYIEIDPKTFGVEPILKELAKLKKSEVESRLVKHYDEAYQWVLWPAFLLLLIETLLSDRRRIRRKTEEVSHVA